MKRLVLLFPAPSERYGKINIGYEEKNNPPQSGHGILAACAKRANPLVEVKCLTEQKKVDGNFEFRSNDEMIAMAEGADIVGITCWFHNMENALAIARGIKEVSPNTKVVLGGHNVANPKVGEVIISKYSYVDAVCYAKEGGEKAVEGLASGLDLIEVPNLVVRVGGGIHRTKFSPTPMHEIPIFDFSDAIDNKALLDAHDGRKTSFVSTMPRVGVLSLRGCQKAAVFGLCHYCTSATKRVEPIPEEKFWEQIDQLWQRHGISDFFIIDDVFPISLEYIRKLHATMQRFKGRLPKNLRFRAYAYPDNFQRLIAGDMPGKHVELAPTEGDELAKLLTEIGVKDIFFGVESFDSNVLAGVQKAHYDVETIMAAIELLARHGITSAIAVMLGLPNESTESLRRDVEGTRRLLEAFGTRSRSGGLGRLDISLATPLIGTPWHIRLITDGRIISDYIKETGLDPRTEVTPDYILLLTLSLQYYSSVGMDAIRETAGELKELSYRYLKHEMIGGFI